MSTELKAENICGAKDRIIGEVTYIVKQPHKIVENYMQSKWFSFIYQPTKSTTIDQYLTFRKGEPLDEERIKESVRKLREAKFIWDASYEIKETNDCKQDVIITFYDTFPFKPKLSFSRRSSTNKSAIGLVHNNLFGSGTRLKFEFKKEKLRDQKILEYINPNFGSQHYSFSGLYSDNSDGKETDVRIEKPFYEFDSEKSFGLTYDRFQGDLQLYNNSEVILSDPYELKKGKIYFGYGNDGEFGFQQKRRSLYLLKDNANYLNLSNLNRNITTFGMQYKLFNVDFIEVKNVRHMSQTEDYNQGPTISLDLGVSYDKISGQLGHTLGLTYQQNFIFDSYTLLQTDINYGGYFFNNYLDENHLEGLIQLNLFQPKYFESWNFQLQFSYNDNPKPENYILMDEEFPIRGFPFGHLLIDSYSSINIEKRWFNIARYLDVFDVAAVAFYDIGSVSVGASAFSPKNRESLQSVGFGLRISPTKLTNDTVIHIDLAYPINETLQQDYQLNIFGVSRF